VAGAADRIDLKMNLRRLKSNVAAAEKNVAAALGFFRQIRHHGVMSPTLIMSMCARNYFLALCLGWACLAAFATSASAQTNYYTTNGTEYAVIGSLPGDQVFPDVAISPAGGFVVWQDNITDGDGWGVSARKLDDTLSGTLGTFRVNVQGAGDQENARVALLKNGGAAFVWQGGAEAYQHIYARFLTPTNTFMTSTDLLVNASTNYFQITPAVTTLNNSNVVMVWVSYDEASSTSLQDVYGQIFSPAGKKIGGEFLINQFTDFNQRTPTIAALTNGGFVVAWVSEQERQVALTSGSNSVAAATSGIVTASVDIYARLYNSSGTAVGNEFLVNDDFKTCAEPSVAVAADNSLMVVWTAHDTVNPNNSWDVYGRIFTNGVAEGSVFYVNSHLYGDQYSPRISSLGLDYMVTWTSLGQDGSREGVYGQFVHDNGLLTGGEFRVNTTTVNQQMQAAVASDGAQQFLAVWTGFVGGANGFDLYGQRYINVSAVMQAMPAPFVWVPFVLSNNVYQPRLVVSWAPLLGLSVSNYEVYVDGAASPTASLVSNVWTMTALNGLTTNSTHSFQVDYVTTGGQRSPLSPSASGTTWSGLSWGGIPYEWMAEYFSDGIYNTNFWPAASAKVGPNTTLSQIFLTGGNPQDSSTWLATQLTHTSEGMFLSWNTQPGATYQVQITTNFASWSNVGSPRFAAGTSDSIFVGGNPVGYYRLVLLR
jgi:hypothetical protein